MGDGDRVENHGQDLKGKIKEAVGDATDNDRLRSEGRGDQMKADLKNVGEDIKDAFRGDDDRR